MPVDHDFGYFYPLFSSLIENEGRRKGELKQNCDQKSCLSACPKSKNDEQKQCLSAR